ncbi:HET-domain-containing protein, partial [Lepidopterella palustris CBS 459.81]
LIDVEKECIVAVPEPQFYVALSYVWGDANTLQNKRANKHNLEQPGGLSVTNPLLPNTIKDAMILVKLLGEHYLWVDCLCITQDDNEVKDFQMKQMYFIYECATFTLIAACGEDANAGLPGIQEGSRAWRQHTELVKGIMLANRPVLPEYSEQVWAKRAWRLQEEGISPRKLYMLSNSVVLKYEEGDFYEDEYPMEKAEAVNQDDLSSGTTNFVRYANIVEEYTRRSMKFNTDIINAFEGLMTKLRPIFRGDFVFGLPTTELESALLWQPTDPLKRRVDEESKALICPSWSWAGWEG